MRLSTVQSAFSATGKKPSGQSQYRYFLIYGNDDAAIEFNTQVLCQNFKKGGVTVQAIPSLLQIKTHRQEPDLFSEEKSAKKAYVVRNITGRDFDAIQELVKTTNEIDQDHYIIFVAGNLGSKIKLVQLFQKEANLAACASYEISTDLLRSVIESTLKDYDISLSLQQIALMCETYAGSSSSLFTDCYKIALYLDEQQSVDDETLKQLINGSSQLDIEKIVSGFLLRDKNKILRHADSDLLESEPYLVLRSLIRQVEKFCEYMAHLRHTNNSSQAFQSMSSPVFFQTKSLFQSISTLWTEKLAAFSLQHLLQLEYRYKAGDLSPLQFQAELCLFSR